MFNKAGKKLLAAVMALLFTLNCFSSSVYASFEDGLVILGMDVESRYDSEEFDYDFDYEVTPDNTWTNSIEAPKTTPTETSPTETKKEESPILENKQNTESYINTTGSPFVASFMDLKSGPNDYLNANGGTMTIVAEKPLRNILHYDGNIITNIHIAKWVVGDPTELKYPAYCASPGLKGVAQNADQQYKIVPQSSLTDTDKRVLAVLRAGYPFKTPAELGVDSQDDAYYATHAAIHTTIQNGDLSKWSVDGSDVDKNTKILNAMKQVYNEGNANPYTPPDINFELSAENEQPVQDSSKQWIENTYQVKTGYPYNFYRFELRDDTIKNLVDTGKVVVESGGSTITPQLNIDGVWDNVKAYKIPAGQSVTVKMDKATADGAGGVNFPVVANICDVDFANTYSYLGEPTGLSGNWQRYAYTSIPFATDISTYNYVPTDIPVKPDEPVDPDNPSTSSAGSLVIEKLDYNTKQKVKDAVFHIKGIDPAISYMNITVKASSGATVPTVSAGKIEVSDGVIKLSEIPAGSYEVTEVSPPPHYSVSVSQNSQSIEVKNDAEIHPKVTFENQPYGSLVIQKIDEDDGTPLAGVYFKVVNHTTGFEQSVVTDTSGKAEILDIPEGSYEVTEIATRPDYILNPTPAIGEVDWGEETIVTLKNKSKPRIEILKIDSETSEPISGVKFEIKNKNTQQVFSETTDNDGKIMIMGVDEGWYDVTEVTPAAGYIANTEVHEIYAESGKPSSITIKNTKKSGITIEKVDIEGKGLEGVTFNIFRFGEDTPIPNSPITTGKDGIVAITDLMPGHYQVQEVQPLQGYMANREKYDLVVEEGETQTTKIQIVNKRLPDLTVRKVDANDVDTPLAGAMFEVKEVDGQALQGSPYTTDAKGEFKIEDIDLGETQSKKLMVTEIKAPEGYNLSDPITQYITMEPDKDVTLTFKNYKKSGISIQKTDINGNGLEGVSFNIFRFGENTPIPNSPVITGKDGTAVLNNLLPGHYQVQEVAALPGYLLDTKKYDLIVEEGSDKTTILKVVNKRLPNLTVKKVDTANVDKGLAGAVFKVEEVDGQALPGSPYTTGPDGTFKIEQIEMGNKPSRKLVITEIQPPPGYNLSNPTVQYATMEPDQDILLTFSNAKLPELVIKKVDSKTAKPLAGAVFSVEKLEEPNKGFLTGSPFTTDNNGEIHLPNQGTGSYRIIEQKASQDYIIDTKERIINLKEGEDFTVVFENTKKPTLIVHKVDAITKDPLAGAEFLVTRAVNGSLNGETIEVGKYYSDTNGKFSLNCVEPGWYRILETHPASGYQEVSNYYQDVFLVAGEDKEITFENSPKSAIIIRKIDLETGEALPNIRFQVRYLSGATGSEGTIIGVYKTSLNGSVVVAGLKPGVYSIAEMEADSDHILDDTIQTVTLADDNSVVTVEFTNQPKGGLLIKKMDAVTKEPLSDVIFKITNIKGEVVGESGGEFRTDEKGTIYIPRLMGGFIVKEIKTKDGYILDNTAKTIYIDSGKVFSLEFFNQPENSFVIQKLDGATQKPLAGAIIKVMTADDKLIGEYKTNESGLITISELKPGTYKVQEIKAPAGYCLDDTVKLVHVEQNKPVKLELYNYQKSTIQILKKDAVSKKPLAGAVFKVMQSDGKIIGEFETDAAGTVSCTELEAGTYTVQETKAPAGYLLNSKPQTVVIKENKIYNLEFYNDPQNGFVIMKLDGTTKKALADAQFKVTDINDKLVGEYTTDESGLITISALEPGVYKVQETRAPIGYCLDSTVKLVHIEQNKPVKLDFYNYQKPIIQILKKDAVSQKPLSGAVFKVSLPDGKIIGEYQTDATGIATCPDLEAGTYIVQETKTPAGYLLNSKPQTVVIKENKVYNIEFYNDPQNSFSIQKMDGNTKAPLADARFKVTTVDDKLIGQYRTDQNGVIVINNLDAGTYKVIEIEAPKGYNLDDTVHLVHLKQNEPQKLEVYNFEKAAILIQKKDAVTKEPLGNVKFKVTKPNGMIVGEYITDATGIATVPDIKKGSYVITEIQQPDGYILNSTPQMLDVNENKVYKLEFYNQPLNSFVIVKLDGNTKEPLADATIRVTTVKETLIGEYRTDSSGMISINDILPGTYKVQEIKQPEGYVLDDTVKLVTIEQNQPQKLELFNFKKASLIIQKVDKVTQKPLAKAKFKIAKINGELIGDTYITDSEGKIVVPNLSPGWYMVSEIAAPTGYNLDITASKTIQVKAFDPAIVKFENYKNATLRIEKTDKVTGKSMENVEFSITRSDGKTYGKYRTDKRGEINLENKIPAGDYLTRETETIKGYALDTNIRKVTLNWGDDKLIEWENYPLASLQIEKTDSENGKPISGVQFEIFDKNQKSVGKYTTDSKGKITLDKLLAGDTTYYVQEIEAKEGYISKTGKLSVNTKWGKTAYLEIENNPILGRVKLHKVSADNNAITGVLKGKGLTGAEFTIYDSDGRKVEILTTDSQGYATSGKLRYGDYTMKETRTPLYFLNENETISFKIEKDGETVEIERENKSTVLQVNVEKSGYKEVLAGDTIRYDLFNIQNKSMVPLKNFYLHESIPSDATRITRLFTGTYNQNLNYTIFYKTNKNKEFKILKDNLFTDRMYEIDCTQGLQGNEYVTDIKFEFGSVDVGFREVERPFLYCKVSADLPNGYQFTNHIEVGGMYEMQKVKAEDNFTTSVFAPKPENKGRLPKTGY